MLIQRRDMAILLYPRLSFGFGREAVRRPGYLTRADNLDPELWADPSWHLNAVFAIQPFEETLELCLPLFIRWLRVSPIP